MQISANIPMVTNTLNNTVNICEWTQLHVEESDIVCNCRCLLSRDSLKKRFLKLNGTFLVK